MVCITVNRGHEVESKFWKRQPCANGVSWGREIDLCDISRLWTSNVPLFATLMAVPECLRSLGAFSNTCAWIPLSCKPTANAKPPSPPPTIAISTSIAMPNAHFLEPLKLKIAKSPPNLRSLTRSSLQFQNLDWACKFSRNNLNNFGWCLRIVRITSSLRNAFQKMQLKTQHMTHSHVNKRAFLSALRDQDQSNVLWRSTAAE